MPVPVWLKVVGHLALTYLSQRRTKRPIAAAQRAPRPILFKPPAPGPRRWQLGHGGKLEPGAWMMWKVAPYTVEAPGQLTDGLQGARLHAACYIGEGRYSECNGAWIAGGRGRPLRYCPAGDWSATDSADGGRVTNLQLAPGPIRVWEYFGAPTLADYAAGVPITGVRPRHASLDWTSQRWTRAHKATGISWLYFELDSPPYGPGIGSRLWGDGWPMILPEVDGRIVPVPGAGDPAEWAEQFSRSATAARWFLERKALEIPVSAYDLTSVRQAQSRANAIVRTNIEGVRWQWIKAAAQPDRPLNDENYPSPGWSLPPVPAGDDIWVTVQSWQELLGRWWPGWTEPVLANSNLEGLLEAAVAEAAATVGQGMGPDIEIPDIDIDPDLDDPELPGPPSGTDPNDPNNSPRERLIGDSTDPRYPFDAEILSTDLVRDVFQELDFAWAGTVHNIDGIRRFAPGDDWPAHPTLMFTPETAELVESSIAPALADRVNRIKARISRSRTQSWEPESVTIEDPDQRADDGLTLEVDLGESPGTVSPTTLKRLGYQWLRRARNRGRFSVRTLPGARAEWLDVRKGDVVNAYYPDDLAHTAPVRWLVVDDRFVADWNQVFDCEPLPDGVYGDGLDLPHLVPDISIPGQFPGELTGLALNPQGHLDESNNRRVRMLVNWDLSATPRAQIRHRIVLLADESLKIDELVDGAVTERTIEGPWTSPWQTITVDDANETEIPNTRTGARYEAQGRNVTSAGVEGNWSPSATAVALDPGPGTAAGLSSYAYAIARPVRAASAAAADTDQEWFLSGSVENWDGNRVLTFGGISATEEALLTHLAAGAGMTVFDDVSNRGEYELRAQPAFSGSGAARVATIELALRLGQGSPPTSGSIVLHFTPAGFDGVDGAGWERVFRVHATSTTPIGPDNGRVYEPVNPTDGFTDGLTGLSADTPWYSLWERKVRGLPEVGESPYSSGTSFKRGWGPWRHIATIQGWARDGRPGNRGLAGFGSIITRAARAASLGTLNAGRWHLDGATDSWLGNRVLSLGGTDTDEEDRLSRIGVGGLVTLFGDINNWCDHTLRSAVTFSGTGSARVATISLAPVEGRGQPPASGALSVHFTPQGTKGVNGSVWHFGTAVPASSLGADGDYYLRTSDSSAYQKANGAWTKIGDLSGADGATWLQGMTPPPDSLGNDDDFYFQSNLGIVYRKVAGAWVKEIDLPGKGWTFGGVHPDASSDTAVLNAPVGSFYLLGISGSDDELTYHGTTFPDGAAFERVAADSVVFADGTRGDWMYIADLTGPQGVPGVRGISGYARSGGFATRVATAAAADTRTEWHISGVPQSGAWPVNTVITLGGLSEGEQGLFLRIANGGLFTVYIDDDNWGDYVVSALAITASGQGQVTARLDESAGAVPAIGEGMTFHVTPAGADGEPGINGLSGYTRSGGFEERVATAAAADSRVKWHISGVNNANEWPVNTVITLGGLTEGEQGLLLRTRNGTLFTVIANFAQMPTAAQIDRRNFGDYVVTGVTITDSGQGQVTATLLESRGNVPAIGKSMTFHHSPEGEKGESAAPPPSPITVRAVTQNAMPDDVGGGVGIWSILYLGFADVPGAIGYRIVWTEHWSDGDTQEWSQDRATTPSATSVFRSINRGNDTFIERWSVFVHSIAQGAAVGQLIASGPSPTLRVAANTSTTSGGSTTGTDAPASLAAGTGNGEVVLTWDARQGVTYSGRYRTSPSGTWQAITSVMPGEVTVTGLTNGTVYDFEIREETPNVGDWARVTATPARTSLTAPTGLAITNPRAGVVIETWGAVANASGYEVRNGPVETGYNHSSVVTATTRTTTGATQGNYRTQVRAFEDVGGSRVYGPWSAALEFEVTLGAPGRPSPPRNVRDSWDADGDDFTVAYDTPTSDGGSAIRKYLIRVYPRIGTGSDAFQRNSPGVPDNPNSRSATFDLTRYDRGGSFFYDTWAFNGSQNSALVRRSTRRPYSTADTRSWSDWSAWTDAMSSLPLRNSPGLAEARAPRTLSRYDANLIKSGVFSLGLQEALLGSAGIYGAISYGQSNVALQSNASYQAFLPFSLSTTVLIRNQRNGTPDAEARWSSVAIRWQGSAIRDGIPAAAIAGLSIDAGFRDGADDLLLDDLDRMEYPDIGSGRGEPQGPVLLLNESSADTPPSNTITQTVYVPTTMGVYKATRTLS